MNNTYQKYSNKRYPSIANFDNQGHNYERRNYIDELKRKYNLPSNCSVFELNRTGEKVNLKNLEELRILMEL